MTLKNRYIATIYEGVVKRKTLKQIQRDIYDITINKKRIISKPLTAYAIKLSRKANKIADSDIVLLISLLNKANINSHKIINNELRKDESDAKIKLINRFMKENRKWDKNFYVCSMHDDSAEDHRPYQGKIYYNELATYNDDERTYIRQHNLRSVQYITDSPVYMITRPNCRHYFVSYTGSDILNKRYTIPHRAIGKGVNSQLAFYNDRLVMYKRLNNIKPNERLKADIKRTKSLVGKYKR